MKANELMIGDWVSYRGIVNKVAPADFCHKTWIDEIEPIPITPKILEKNGFLYNQDYDVWICFVNEITITVGIYHPDFINIGYEQHTPDGVDKCELSSICKVDGSNFYVHQLQHALRLCGIDKNIVL